MTRPDPQPASVYCRQCRRPVAFAADFCPKCGAADPGGRKAALVGALVVGGLVAATVAAAYAWFMSWDWERWERKFARLPDGHPLAGAPWETAVGIGAVVFVVAWVVSVLVLARLLRPAPARG